MRTAPLLVVLSLVAFGCATPRTSSPGAEASLLMSGCTEKVRPPVLLSGKRPEYPQVALDEFMEGHASARCTVTREGRAERCRLSYAPPGLEQAFLDSIETYRFQPAVACGKAVEHLSVLRFHFQLPPEAHARRLAAQAEQAQHPASAMLQKKRPLAFNGEMTPPVQIEGKRPEYTPEAIAAGVEGLAVIKCVITTQGLLERCRILQSVPGMDEAILEALATHRYRPVTYKGQAHAVDYTFNIRMRFPGR